MAITTNPTGTPNYRPQDTDARAALHAALDAQTGSTAATRRGVTPDELDAVLDAIDAGQVTRRIRAYSPQGFVPNSYRYRCQIQYVEGVAVEGGWRVTLGWTGAQRSRGQGALIVIQ